VQDFLFVAVSKRNVWLRRSLTWIVTLKAKIQAKQNDKKGAVASAEKVITLATEAKNDDYVAMAKKLIAENK